MFKFPSSICFWEEKNTLNARYNKKKSKYEIDIWGIAYMFSENVGSILDLKDIETGTKYYNSLSLRLYFLSEVIEGVTIKVNGSEDYRKDAKAFIEKIGNKEYITYRDKLNERGTKQKPESKIEKKLFDNKIFGIMHEKLTRQWPANIFEKEKISNETRITRKRWIDLVGIDKEFHLSAVEIKAGKNLPLDLFVQNFDYMVYLHLFKKHILDNFFEGMGKACEEPICGYYIAERYHPLLEKYILPRIKVNTENFRFKYIEYDAEAIQAQSPPYPYKEIFFSK